MKRITGVLSVLSLAFTSFAQPHLVKDIWAGSSDSYMSEFTSLNGSIYFTANDGVHGLELWKSNGTGGGTVMVKDINPGHFSSIPESFIAINGTLYFSANDGIHGYELWKSDGTSVGTQMVRDINPGGGDSYSRNFAELNGVVYFNADDGVHGHELWKTDGTSARTMMVKDIWPGFLGSSPLYLTKVSGYLYFSATHPDYDFELWRTDGTEAGTQLVKDIWPGSPGTSLPRGLTASDGMLFFFAESGTGLGRKLWKSDGTNDGTTVVKSNLSAAEFGFEMQEYNGYVYFMASDGIHGLEVWKSDGNVASTVMVKDINPGSANSYPGSYSELSGELFFTASNEEYDFELWKTDGTWGGTKLVKDINPGATGSHPFEFISMNGALYFTADDGQHGSEFWMSDGSESGTRMVADIVPGSRSSYPLGFTNADDKIFFAASDDAHGRELWVFEPLSEKVTGFILVNAVSDNDILELGDDAVINLAALPTNKLNIRADVGSPNIRSIVFELNGVPFRTESVAPFALAGDNPPGNYHPWTPAPGHYELCAIPYTGANGEGNMGIPTCISFTVVDVSFGVTHFTLVNSETNEDIMNFFDEDNWDDEDIVEFDLSGLPHPERINIRVNTYPPLVGAVGFGFDGDDYANNEYAAPYALFGDNNGNYKAWQDVLPRSMGGSCANEGYHHCAVWVWADANNPEAGEYSTFFRFRLKYDDIRVTGFTLVNAVTDQDIVDIHEGDVIDLSSLATNKLNLRANTEPPVVGSAIFNGKFENVAPYSLHGDRNGDYHQWKATPGSYQLQAIPYSQAGTLPGRPFEPKGVCGIPLSVSFELIQSGATKNRIEKIASASIISELQVYPNPNEGVFNVSFSVDEVADVKIEVFDLLGKIVFRKALLSFSGIYNRQFDISDYSQGVYFLKVNKNNTETIKKIIVNPR